eukprot:11557136-Heterocapsa_arctica.AAC.1
MFKDVKKVRLEDYKLATGEQLDKMAGVVVLQQGVKLAMLHMQMLCDKHHDDDVLAPAVRGQLTGDLLGILYFNAWAGRC